MRSAGVFDLSNMSGSSGKVSESSEKGIISVDAPDQVPVG
jgi:hypothetical protein